MVPRLFGMLLLAALAHSAQAAGGDSFRMGDPHGKLGEKPAKVVRAIAAELGLDAAQIAVHLVDDLELRQLNRKWGGASIGHNWSLDGLEYLGQVYVKH